MKKDGSPGLDGFTYEFYDANWDTVSEDLLQTYNNAYIQKRLPSSMNAAVVKLTPKTGDLTDVKNWRPISLLNVDYKILARAIYNKIIHSLSGKASQNQKAIFPGRNIMEILLNTESAIQFAKERRNFNAAILKIDLQKAFDNVQHNFMFKMLKKFQVPDPLIQWIKILYQNPTSTISVNGALTPSILIKKGIRQGCPLSMLLFGLVLEALIQKIDKNDGIKGIDFGKETKLKIQACADDITFYITNKESLDLIMMELNKFGEFSGQQINDKKTEIIVTGHFIKERFQSSIYMPKVKSKLTILGTSFSFSEDLSKQNFVKIAKTIQSGIDLQKHRGLTLYGKVNIIKSKLISLVFHKLQFMFFSVQNVNQIEDMLFQFLWFPEKYEFMDRRLLIAKCNEGGINMVDFSSKYKAALVFKLKYIAKATNKNEFWIKYAFYNIGTTLKYLNVDLYSNSEPHKTFPDKYWNAVKQVIIEIHQKKIDIDWESISYKKLYDVFRSQRQLCSDNLKPWQSIQLYDKFKYMFTNKEREASYLIAHNSIHCGQQMRRMEKFVDVCTWNLHNCKFCKNLIDNADHIFSGECKLVNKLYQLCRSMFWWKTKKKLCFDKKLIFFNQTGNMEEDYSKVKLMVIIKKTITYRKRKTR